MSLHLTDAGLDSELEALLRKAMNHIGFLITLLASFEESKPLRGSVYTTPELRA